MPLLMKKTHNNDIDNTLCEMKEMLADTFVTAIGWYSNSVFRPEEPPPDFKN